MAGFIQDPLQFINLIADNLRDRYQSGFPVLKELVQNTDDSEATELQFGRSPGLSGDERHVLLRGPALFFINNGRFSSSDALGIRSFGQNSKAADQTSIGKFGLGMKSVFHFCEAFFFLAHDGQRSYAEVLNPWSGSEPLQSSLHAEWDQFSEADAQAIRDHLAPVTAKAESKSNPEHLFILWLPLRRTEHLKLQDGSQAGAIVSEYPGDDPTRLAFLEDKDLPVRLAVLMPLLRHLKSISYWKLQDQDEAANPCFKVDLDNGAQRLSLLQRDSEPVDSAVPINGRIRVDNGTPGLLLGFSGLEGYGWSGELKTMHGNELWPSSYVRENNGHSKKAKDKARPHGAIFFSRSAGSGQLITNWSVFLPLDEVKAVETVRCEGENDFRLTLHGYFFVDAGRQKVHGLDTCTDQTPKNDFNSEDSLRRAWNCELLCSIILPLLLPALNAFCADECLSDEAKTALSAALRNTAIVRGFHGSITKHHSWLREITSGGIAWVLRSAERSMLKLPNPPDRDPSRPWRLFPALASIAERHWLAIADAPNLVKPSVDAQWRENQLLDLLASVDAGTLFAESTLLDYLESFLAEAAGPYRATLSVKRALIDLVKQGLVGNGEEGLRQNEARVRRIVNHLESSACFRIVNDLPRSLLQGLLSAGTNALPLSARFFPQEAPGDAVLSVADAASFLMKVEEALAGAADSNTDLQNAALKLSEHLIKGVPAQHRSELLRRCFNLQVLGGHDCSRNQRVPISVHEICKAKEAGTLFGNTGGITERARLGLAVDLQKVLPASERVLVINRETASLAFNAEGAIPSCDEHAVLRCLGLKPRILGGLRERAALAGLAHIVPEGREEVRGLRFLLHANPEHFDRTDRLWVLGWEQAPVWQKLWAQLVGGAIQPWNLVDGSIADTLSRREWDAVNIHEISAQSVLDEIERRGISVLNPLAFDRDECEQILKEVRDSDDNLWRSLPFHWTRKEAPVSGDASNAYLDPNIVSVPDDMLREIDLIQLSDDAALAQRQKRVLRSLDEQAAIQIALDHPDVPDRWRIILDALGALNQQRNEPSPDLQKAIKGTKWLSIADGNVAKPEDVIDLDAAEEEIDRVLAREPGAFVTPRTLATAIAEHPFFPKLRESYFARGREGLAQLSAALEALDDYQIGSVRFDNAEALNETAQVLGEHSNAGWQLLSTLIDNMGAEDCLKELLPGMRRTISIDSLVALLNWIAGRSGDESRVVRVFNRYLRVFAQEGQASSVFDRLNLRNQESQWSLSARLVSGVSGIAPGHMLDSEQARMLNGLIFHERRFDANPVDLSEDPGGAGPILKDYFNLWTGRVSPLSVAALLVLFSGDKTVRCVVKDLLGQHSIGWLIGEYPWNMPPRGRFRGYSLQQAIQCTRISCTIHTGTSVSVHSVLGAPINVPLGGEVSTLFVGSLTNTAGNQFKLALRKIEMEEFSDQQLSSLLKNSISYLLREVYEQNISNLDQLWGELDQLDQVDIELAKALILDNIPFYLKQLGTHKHPALREKLERFREYERQEKEFGGQPKAEKYRQQKEQALKDLQRLIEDNAGAQRAILNSVQRKIKDFQYQPESVPFELFQNADDALCHLELINAYPANPGDLDVEELPAGIRKFVIEADTNQISFMHWGRAINQFGSRGFPGREQGFDRDLENMLILSASDKGENVTGKFGLGFKSVWLVSDCPTIVSGRLRADIVGGVLPVVNHGQITQGLVSRLAMDQADRRWAGTAIHLPLREGVSEDTVLDRFCSVAGTMVAFSRSLRTIKVQRNGNGSKRLASWEPRVLSEIGSIQMGRIRQSDGGPLLAMKILLGEGALLLAVGPSGFVELPKTIPSLWVTAPIREQEQLGFAINAMFEVDAGRSRLSAEVAQNEAHARRLGIQLATKLEQLYIAVVERWGDIARSMELAPGVQPYDFWHSLWRTLMTRLPRLEKDSGARIVATALLSEGLGHLAETCEVVPNGLSKEQQRLIRAAEAKTVLRGALADPAILEVVANVSCFRSWLDVESAVSSDMATWLRLLVPSLSQQNDRLQSISLDPLIRQLDRHKEVLPDDANMLGKVLNSKTLESWDRTGEDVSSEIVKDFKAAAERAGDLSFLSASGSVKRCKQLLSDRGSEDEKRRWAFAPDHVRLSDQYKNEGTAFFLWCRDKLEAPADKLKEWIIQAADTDRRKAALRYLLEGELASQVVKSLHERGLAGSWLAAVDEDSDLLSDWEDIESRKRLVYQILKTPEESRIAFQNASRVEKKPKLDPIEPKAALERIYEWWIQARGEHLECYCRKTYPEGRLPNLKEDDAGNIDRSSWLLVLLLGGFHTMGRTLPEQHRTFIEVCQHHGWWEVFTAPKPAERFEDWMRVLDEYIDQQVDQQQYEQWMMRFPIIYKLSRHLDDYAELLLGLDRHRSRFDLAAVLQPWADSDQQGGGIGAAALPRTLGIGANFVIRELIRLGVIDSPHLREHAFVPYRRVRRLIAEMGCTDAESTEPGVSLVISDFLHQHVDVEKTSFCGDFDIPLRIVAGNVGLQQELLGRSLSSYDVDWFD